MGTGAGAEAGNEVVATTGVANLTVWGAMVGFRLGWVGCVGAGGVGAGGVGASTFFAVPSPLGLLVVLAWVMARYLSKISSSSSMTSGSSSRSMSSGTVVMALGGAMMPFVDASPTFLFPFSAVVGGLVSALWSTCS